MPTDLGRGTHALLRIAVGVLFLQHGLQKLFGLFGGVQGGTVAIFSQLGLAGVLEFAGGVFLILGLFTRPVALLLLAEMIVAYFIAHLPRGGWPIQNQGELALLYASTFAFLAANGAGPLSMDAALPAHRAGDRRRDEIRRQTPERRHRPERRHPAAA